MPENPPEDQSEPSAAPPPVSMDAVFEAARAAQDAVIRAVTGLSPGSSLAAAAPSVSGSDAVSKAAQEAEDAVANSVTKS